MNQNFNFPEGSIWRKWDLQIQPVKTEWCSNLDCHRKQIEEATKAYINAAIEKKIEVVAITDHNTCAAIDIAMKYSEEKRGKGEKIYILPGVELDADSGEHIIIILNPEYKKRISKNSWKEAVETILVENCGITPPFFDNNCNSKKIKKCTEDLLEEINRENIGLLIFAHCLSDEGGFFKRCGDSSKRKNIVESYLNNFQSYKYFIFDIKEYKNLEKIKEQINKWSLDDKKYPIISCSDAHQASEVGSYFTWIKADPTFEGLKQIIYEPEERIYIGEEPEIVRRVRENKTKFIKSIKINQNENYREDDGVWFKDIEILLNPGLVSIIGNRGSGKSALTDIISLCGNSNLYKDFSFLTEEKFLKNGLAIGFKAELIWESNENIIKKLSDNIDSDSPERVRYLPQNFFEKLSNNLEIYEFENILQKVIFSYIPEEKKFAKNSFDDLVKYKQQIMDIDINNMCEEITKLNQTIINYETKIHPEYKKQIEQKLALKVKELEEHEKIKPQEIINPEIDKNLSEELRTKQGYLQTYYNQLNDIEKQIGEAHIELKEINIKVEDLKRVREEILRFKEEINNYINNNITKLKIYGLDLKEILSINIDLNKINSKIKEIENKQKELENILMPEEQMENTDKSLQSEIIEISLKVRQKKIIDEIEKLKNQLSEPQKKYQSYLEELKKWENKNIEIEGNENTIGSIKWLKKELDFINRQLKDEIVDLRNKRLGLAIKIYNIKKQIMEIFKDFKDTVDKKILELQDILSEFKITIDVSLKIKPDFYDEFLKFINQNVRGSFYGKKEGRDMLYKILSEKDINNEADIKSFLSELIDYLEIDKREDFKDREEKRYIEDQIIKNDKWLDFYDYVFSLNYIETVYKLKLGNKELIQLSPGEKGALLIVFYLLLDKDDIPLIIDQPEENLDNESIYKILRHIIKYAKKRRQVLIVTHNPNLAIVGDAEQIIFVKIDKEKRNEFSFRSGSIENPKINKYASDILEGTLKAFDIRRFKYLRIKS